jgi:hypothetical protein
MSARTGPDLRAVCLAAQDLGAPVALTVADQRELTGRVGHAGRESVQLDCGTVPYRSVSAWRLAASGDVPAGRYP